MFLRFYNKYFSEILSKKCSLSLLLFKKYFYFFLFFLIFNNNISAQTIVMRIALQTPETDFLNLSLLEFEKKVEILSNGTIDVEILHSGSLSNDDDMPNAVNSGLVEAGVVSLNRYIKEVPSVDIFFQPFLFKTKENYEKSISPTSEIRLSLETEINKIGSKVLFWLPYGNVVFLSNNLPILRPSDLEEKNVRIFSKTLANLVLVSRGNPKIISNSRQYFSYQTGETDIGMTYLSSINNLKLWEVMDTMTLSNHARLEFIIITNSLWWQQLNFRNKEIIKRAASETEDFSRYLFKDSENKIINELKERGMIVYEIEKNDLELWQKMSSPIYEKFYNSDILSKDLFNIAKYY